MKNLKWKLLTIVGVIVFAAAMIYPPFDTPSRRGRISLGLDLKGGVQLVLRVKTDEALQYTSEDAAERLRLALREKNIAGPTITVPGPTRIAVAGVPQPMDGAFRTLADAQPELVAQYTRTGGAGGYTFELKPNVAQTLRLQAVEQALQTVERRVNALGVSDVERAKQIIKSTAQLRLTLVDQGPFGSREAALAAYDNALPPGLDVLPGKADPDPSIATIFYVVHRTPVLVGSDLRSAQQTLDEFNRPAVGFTLKPEAARRFGEITQQNINRPLATVLDNRVMSVATIQSRIDDSGQISGVSREEMIEQVINLNSGALPADL